MQQLGMNDGLRIAVLQARVRQLESQLGKLQPALRLWLDGSQRVLSPNAVQQTLERLLEVCTAMGIKPALPTLFAFAVVPETCTCRAILLALADACDAPDSRSSRKPFVTYSDHVRQDLLRMGFTQEQFEALDGNGLPPTDIVTGFWEGRTGKGRFWTLRQAIQHVKETNELAVYVDIDLMNLGGLNAALGGHTKANEVYSEIAAIVCKRLSAVASDAIFFRHGGDEMSVFMIDTTEEAVLAALALAKHDVLQLAKKYGLDSIPHPKHQGDGRMKGIGIHFGICRIQPEYDSDPTAIFRTAEADSERRKRPGE